MAKKSNKKGGRKAQSPQTSKTQSPQTSKSQSKTQSQKTTPDKTASPEKTTGTSPNSSPKTSPKTSPKSTPRKTEVANDAETAKTPKKSVGPSVPNGKNLKSESASSSPKKSESASAKKSESVSPKKSESAAKLSLHSRLNIFAAMRSMVGGGGSGKDSKESGNTNNSTKSSAQGDDGNSPVKSVKGRETGSAKEKLLKDLQMKFDKKNLPDKKGGGGKEVGGKEVGGKEVGTEVGGKERKTEVKLGGKTEGRTEGKRATRGGYSLESIIAAGTGGKISDGSKDEVVAGDTAGNSTNTLSAGNTNTNSPKVTAHGKHSKSIAGIKQMRIPDGPGPGSSGPGPSLFRELPDVIHDSSGDEHSHTISEDSVQEDGDGILKCRQKMVMVC
jgi:hypothetical protein